VIIIYMRYKLLGKSGLRVSELCLGGMTFGEDWGSMLPGASKEGARKIFDIYLLIKGATLSTLQMYTKKELVRSISVNSFPLNERSLF
jgi:aryl-alcohol dehydrogenase-like predicted oxidoreductase